MKLTAEQRYRQALAKVRIQSRRDVRRYLAGEIDFLPGADERTALIAELDRAYAAGFQDGRAPTFWQRLCHLFNPRKS